MRALVPFCIVLSGCAYIGDPLPPSLKIPEAVKDLSATQRGDKVYVDFTPAVLTMDGTKLEPPGETAILVGEAGADPTQKAEKTFAAGPWVGKEIVIGVRTRGPSGRLSGWSNMVTLRIEPPLAKPQNVRAKDVPAGVELTWRDGAPRHRIYRDSQPIGTVDTPNFVDSAIEYGKSYEYSVQGLLEAAESEISAGVAITPEDKFGPEAPRGLTLLAGIASVELSWDRSPASDFAFYRVYRDGKLIADNVTATVYGDRSVQSGVKYRYAVTAVDRKLNESAQSAPVEITFP